MHHQQLCEYGARELCERGFKPKINDINREIYRMNCVMIKEHHGKLRNKMDLLENMEQLIDLKEDLILHHLDV